MKTKRTPVFHAATLSGGAPVPYLKPSVVADPFRMDSKVRRHCTLDTQGLDQRSPFDA
jgi:hypothetical protein